MERGEKIDIVAKKLGQGGFSTIWSFVSDVPDEILDAWVGEEDDEEYEGEDAEFI